MASQIAVNVSLSSLQWSETRERGDKLVMVINVVVRGKKSFVEWKSSPKLHERLDDAEYYLHLYNPAPCSTQSFYDFFTDFL